MSKDKEELLTRACANIDLAQKEIAEKSPVLAGELGAVKFIVEKINEESINE